ncbi:MAG: hypothetical protein ACFFD5_16145 [Candidatus Thorarchaeota archaeon]
MKSVVKLKKFLLVLISISIILAIVSIEVVQSSDNNEVSLNIKTDFQMNETSVIQGDFENLNSIDIDLPSSSWNLNDIELNFTEIEFEPDLVTIEDNYTHNTYKWIYNKNPAQNLFGLAVQIELSEPSIIYGLYIYGYNYLEHPGSPQIQIRGYDDINNRPNSEIFGSVSLNITEIPGWYLQNFSSPVSLSNGNYSLVLNGTMIPAYAVNNAGFYWAYNAINPNYPGLYTSEYNSGWSIGSPGEPFLYKLIQKLNESFYPEDINMTTEFNGYSFGVLNGNAQGKGYLKRNNIHFTPNNEKVKMQIKNNKTNSLKFNLTYNFNIFNIFEAPGMLNVTINKENEWNINPEITRVSNNHSIQFYYPKSWANLKIFKNQLDVTSEVILDITNHSLIIPNDTIENDVNWEIVATSLPISFNLNTPRTEFKTGQEMRFSISPPVLNGNYTFLLFDPDGLEKYQTTKILPTNDNLFSYEIPMNSIEGNYIAYLIWNNETDAGYSSQIFTISKASIIPNQNAIFFLIIGLVIAGGVTIGFSGYVTVKKIESKRREKLNLILTQCNDIMNIKYIIVLDVKTGIDLFAQSFEKKELDPTLISGFLQAIHNFGVEVIEGAKNSKTVKVEYKDSIIFMTEFINLRLIIIMKNNPSKNFIYSIESLAYHIYKYYGKYIDNFQGNLKPFRSIKKLVESDLNVSLLYPLTVTIKKDMKLNQDERDMVKKAQTFMKEHNSPYFYFLYLIPENACSPKDYQITLQLIKKGTFQPIDKKEYSN